MQIEGTGPTADAVVIGGGFYGSAIAIYLAKTRGLRHVVLVEREARLLQRASLNNQARVHNGYHYPRSFTTAYRSRMNLPLFVRDWPEAVTTDFTKLYAIARRNSKVTSRQFIRFCAEIGATLQIADPSIAALFERRLIEEIFVAHEPAFDTNMLAQWAQDEIRSLGITTLFDRTVVSIEASDDRTTVAIRSVDGAMEHVRARSIFNCTYSGLNRIGGSFPGTRTRLKHELTEMALMEVPPSLRGFGITVMDGPFFSLMPFPSRGLHTLSHVRYTPHRHWLDAKEVDAYAVLEGHRGETRVDRMIRDARRYLPAIDEARHVESLFEIKTVLMKNESDDGRPILFETHDNIPRCYSILGGKIDNIYDVLERLDAIDIE